MKMLSLVTTATCCAAMLLSSGLSAQDLSELGKPLVRSYDVHKRYSLILPPAWSRVSLDDSAMLAAVAPKDSTVDYYAENLAVGAFEVSEELTLLEYSCVSLAKMFQNYPEARVESSGIATLGGEPAVRVVFSWKDPRSDLYLRTAQVITLKDSYGYIVGLTVESSKFESFKPLFDHVVGTFQFEGK